MVSGQCLLFIARPEPWIYTSILLVDLAEGCGGNIHFQFAEYVSYVLPGCVERITTEMPRMIIYQHILDFFIS